MYAAVREVPRGKVTTYGRLARVLGCGSSRAVGQSLRRNPFAPRTPCHRVVCADGSLGGYTGQTSGDRPREKKALLDEEGVVFMANERIHSSCIIDL